MQPLTCWNHELASSTCIAYPPAIRLCRFHAKDYTNRHPSSERQRFPHRCLWGSSMYVLPTFASSTMYNVANNGGRCRELHASATSRRTQPTRSQAPPRPQFTQAALSDLLPASSRGTPPRAPRTPSPRAARGAWHGGSAPSYAGLAVVELRWWSDPSGSWCKS